jgi:hypothetical protein
MASRVVKVTHRSWASRLLNSVLGIILGVLLFFGSFAVLWFTEGRTDMSKIAARSTAVAAASINPATEGQLIAASGRLTSNETVGDPEFLVAGSYIKLERHVEMYAWVERSRSRTERSAGGSERTITEYSYEKMWTANPANSANFQEPAGRHNPSLSVQRRTFTVNTAQVGAYSVDPNRLALPPTRNVTLSRELISGDQPLSGDYVYAGQGSMQQPQVGDLRISFRAVPAGMEVTVFGKQEGQRIVPYGEGRDTLYTAHGGDRDSGIAAMASAYRVTGWIGRVAGFIMMWLGLALVFGPVSVFLDVVPILGKLSRTMVALVTFGVAFFLTIITSVVAAVLQSILGLFCVGFIFVLIIGGGAYYLKRSRPKVVPAV